MQINTNTMQIGFREYKLILDPSQFTGTDNDKVKILSILKSQIRDQKIIFEKSLVDSKVKKVWYLDNNKHELYKNNNFILRVKEKKKKDGKVEYDVTFKIRTSDKAILSSYDLFTLNPLYLSKKEEQKFEEDIVSDSASKFSISTELEYQDNLNLTNLEDVLTVFPNLSINEIKDKQLVRVNGLEVQETKYELGEIRLEGVKKADVGFSIWINPSTGKSPIIGEFDIDIRVEDLIKEKGDKIDVFSDPAVAEINQLYKKLQHQSILNKDNTTKTEYIYKPK
jgi:hypothetical protein